jgi:hypothetical protein
LRRILREPLLHFLLLGIAIFASYGWVSKRISNEPGKIVITAGQIASTAEGFTRTWRRPPTSEELEGLVQDQVREEVYYREALALGMDKDDVIIRRRLRQKMEFVTDDLVAEARPSDEELGAYLNTHAHLFLVNGKLTFTQVFLDPQKHGEYLTRDTTQLLTRLNQTGGKMDVAALGDALLLDHRFDGIPTSEIEKLFGDKFAAKVAELTLGQWQGPIESGYGVHLVFVSERTEGRLPALGEIREAVQREWTNARRIEANEKLYRELLSRYRVTIERWQPAEEQRKLAASK